MNQSLSLEVNVFFLLFFCSLKERYENYDYFNGPRVAENWLMYLVFATLCFYNLKVFVEFGHETSYTKSSSHAEFKT